MANQLKDFGFQQVVDTDRPNQGPAGVNHQQVIDACGVNQVGYFARQPMGLNGPGINAHHTITDKRSLVPPGLAR